jgi:hypothetical protein
VTSGLMLFALLNVLNISKVGMIWGTASDETAS